MLCRVDTFFNCCIHESRLLHRASLMQRLRKAPTDLDFPHPSLLHAICATASLHTAWVTSVPPHLLEETIEAHSASGASLESIPDFGLAQAEASRRTIHSTTTMCAIGPGRYLFEMLQAHVRGIIPIRGPRSNAEKHRLF